MSPKYVVFLEPGQYVIKMWYLPSQEQYVFKMCGISQARSNLSQWGGEQNSQ